VLPIVKDEKISVNSALMKVTTLFLLLTLILFGMVSNSTSGYTVNEYIQFNRPSSIAVDSAGNIYILDSGNHCIQKFDSDGNFIKKWRSQGTRSAQFRDLSGTTVYSSGNAQPGTFAIITNPQQSVQGGTRVVLDGSKSTVSIGASPLSYHWEQISGAISVQLNNADSAMASFVSPVVNNTLILGFRLTVTDTIGVSSPASSSITIVPKVSPPPPE
jgi:hypothetical protein